MVGQAGLVATARRHALAGLADPPLRLSLLMAYAFALMGGFAGVPSEPEHEFHLFLASHYQKSPFSLWDPRWYGGFSVSGHPPFLHALMALTGSIPRLGIERAYGLIVVASALLLVTGVALMVGELGAAKARAGSRRAALFLAVNPLLYFFLFPLGQTPFILGLALAAWATYALARGVRGSDGRWLGAGAALAVVSVSTHPASLVALFGCALVVGVDQRRWKALALCLGGCVIACALTLWPFWSSLATRVAKLPAGKLSLVRGDALAVLSFALAAGMVATTFARRADRTPRLVAALAVPLLLAGASPGAFGLQPEKLLFLGLLCASIAVSGATSTRPWPEALMCALMLVASAYALSGHNLVPSRDFRPAMREVIGVLSKPGHQDWRYLTLGIGNERHELCRKSPVATIDGAMPWLSPLAELRESPYYAFDEIALGEPEGQETLRRLLARAEDFSLRWVVSARPEATPLLEAHGYRTDAAWSGGVLLWSKDGVPPITESASNSARAHRALVWTASPFVWLVLAAALALLGKRQDRHRHAGRET